MAVEVKDNGYEVNGKFVSASDALEIWRAIDRKYHRMDIELRLSDFYDVSKVNDSLMDDIVDIYEDNMEFDNDNWLYCADNAIKDYQERLKPFKVKDNDDK